MGHNNFEQQDKHESVVKNGDSHVSHMLQEVHGEKNQAAMGGGGKFDHAQLLNTHEHEKNIAKQVSECVKDGKLVPGMEKHAEQLQQSIQKQIEQVQAHIAAKTQQLQAAQGYEQHFQTSGR